MHSSFKGLVHPKIKIMLSFTHPLSRDVFWRSDEDKRRRFQTAIVLRILFTKAGRQVANTNNITVTGQ